MNHKWNVITYDVWGNTEDGYEVNDSFTAGHIDLAEEEHFDDAAVLASLIEAGHVAEDTELNQLSFDGDDDVVYICDAFDGKPVISIQRDLRWG